MTIKFFGDNQWSDSNRLIYIAKIADELLSSENLNNTSTLDSLQRIINLAQDSDSLLEKDKDNYRDVLE